MPITGRCRELHCHAMVIRPLHYCRQHADKEEAYQQSRAQWAERDNKKRFKDYDRKRNDDPFKAEQHSFYQKKPWKSLRVIALRRDNYLCQYCLNHKRVRKGNIGDHIVPYEVEAANRLNLDNIATCCYSCHTKKTKWEQIYYGTGYGNKLKDSIPIRNIKDLPDFQKLSSKKI